MRSDEMIRLAAALSAAKTDEESARLRRIEIEEAIVVESGFALSEGSETVRVEDAGGSCVLRLTQPVYTKVDPDDWLRIRRTLPADHPARECFRQKFDVAVGDAKKLQIDDPGAWADVAGCVTRKPGKVSVELKELVLR